MSWGKFCVKIFTWYNVLFKDWFLCQTSFAPLNGLYSHVSAVTNISMWLNICCLRISLKSYHKRVLKNKRKKTKNPRIIQGDVLRESHVYHRSIWCPMPLDIYGDWCTHAYPLLNLLIIIYVFFFIYLRNSPGIYAMFLEVVTNGWHLPIMPEKLWIQHTK